MTEDFEKINKQIAAFIIVSAAMSAPIMTSDISSSVNANVAVVKMEPAVILRYAGPGMIIPEPQPIPDIPVVKYAGPGMIIPEPQPVPDIPVVKYAGPGMIIQEELVKPIPPVLKYAGPANPSSSSSVMIKQDSGKANETIKKYFYNDSIKFNNKSNFTIKTTRYGGYEIEPGHFVFR